jgi:hypothetical protein
VRKRLGERPPPATPITRATRQVVRVAFCPLQVKIRYDEDGVTSVLSLPTYPVRPGEMIIRYLGPGQGRGWRVTATEKLALFLDRAREVVKVVREDKP